MHAYAHAMAAREELDRQYSPSMWSKRLPPEKIVDHHVQCLAQATAIARKALDCELGVCYDQHSGQTLDIYCWKESDSDPAAVLIYFHGGYWTALGVEHSGFFAEPCAASGVVLVAVGYDLAPKVPMTTIVHQCRTASAFVAKKFPKSNTGSPGGVVDMCSTSRCIPQECGYHSLQREVDQTPPSVCWWCNTSSRLFVGGHSAGGHLSACMLYTNWSQYGIENQPLSGAILLSGIYDLDPIQRSCVNGPLQLTECEVREFSPLRKLDQIQLRLPSQFPCLLAIGGEESQEFHRQGEEFHQGLVSVGVVSTNSTLPGMDHYDLTERLTDVNYTLTRAILDFVTATLSQL